MPAVKSCAVCRADLSQQKRVKDQHGNYYCHGCWNARANPAREPVASAATANVAAGGDVSLDDLMQLEAAAANQAAAHPHLAGCSICGGRFPYGDIHNRDGQPVCGECFWKVAEGAAPAADEAESDGTKECPFCAERIQAKAKKCRHCGEFLPVEVGEQSQREVNAAAAPSRAGEAHTARKGTTRAEAAATYKVVALGFFGFTCCGVALLLIGAESYVWGGVSGLIGLTCFGGIGDMISRRCPKCGIWSSGDARGSQIIGSQLETEEVERRDHHYDFFNRPLGSTSRTEQRLVRTNTRLTTYHCRNCGHRWDKASRENA